MKVTIKIKKLKEEKKVRTIYPELEKILLKNVNTGWFYHYPVNKENESEARKLRVGKLVQYHHKNGLDWELCRVEKIIFKKPELKVKGTVFSEFAHVYPYICSLIEDKKIKEYNEKPYFLARLDTIKGKPDGKENLEKMMFPCYVIWRENDNGQDKLGLLVTGFPPPRQGTEYQLIDIQNQVAVDRCCTVNRNTNLKELMKRWHIEVVKGFAQLYKIGRVNV